jgi:histidinol-phosphate aminotransferase
MTGPRYTPLAASLPASVPFVGPEALERARGRPFVARLGANESGFGPSPRAIAAMHPAAAEVWMYADPESHDLRAALAASLGVPVANVAVGEGIDGILGNLVRLLVGPGDAVVTSAGAYPTFAYHVTGFGGVLHRVPYRGDHEDPEALAAEARRVGAKLVYLANPDNPMGTWHPAATIEAMLQTLPDDTLLVLDEAYIEFAPPGTAPALVPNDPRLIRTRTFSKAHGMAGARIGYAVAEAGLVVAFDKVRNHFGISRISQVGALAALGDPGWLADVVARTIAARDRIAGIAAAHGLAALPSATNFVAIDCGGDGALARAMLAELAARDVFARMPGIAPLDRCIRVGTGPEAALDHLAGVFGPALAAARTKVRG